MHSQPVVFDDPPADLRFPASGIARETAGAVEHDADTRSFFLHLGDHMLRGTGREPSDVAGVPAKTFRWDSALRPHELFFAFSRDTPKGGLVIM